MLFRFALRQGRWGLAGYSLLAFLLALLQAAGFYQVAGHTAADRAAFGKSIAALAAQFTVIVPAPLRPDTVGGYVQWRAYGFFAIVFAIWALASGVGASRGDEERGLVEATLASAVARADALIARFAAFTVAVVVAAAAGAGRWLRVARSTSARWRCCSRSRSSPGWRACSHSPTATSSPPCLRSACARMR